VCIVLCCSVLLCVVVDFLCYCTVCLVRGCDKFHIQQSLTDIGSMECVYVNVNVNDNRSCTTGEYHEHNASNRLFS
jgi:hypothetical protein